MAILGAPLFESIPRGPHYELVPRGLRFLTPPCRSIWKPLTTNGWLSKTILSHLGRYIRAVTKHLIRPFILARSEMGAMVTRRRPRRLGYLLKAH